MNKQLTQEEKLKLQMSWHEIKYLMNSIILPSAMAPLFGTIYWDNTRECLNAVVKGNTFQPTFGNTSFEKEIDEVCKELKDYIIKSKFLSKDILAIKEEFDKLPKNFADNQHSFDYKSIKSSIKSVFLDNKKFLLSYCPEEDQADLQKKLDYLNRLVTNEKCAKDLNKLPGYAKNFMGNLDETSLNGKIINKFIFPYIKSYAVAWNEIISTGLVEIFVQRLLGSHKNIDEYFTNSQTYVYLFSQLFEKESNTCNVKDFNRSFMFMLKKYINEHFIKLYKIDTEKLNIEGLILTLLQGYKQKHEEITKEDVFYIDFQNNRYGYLLLLFLLKAARQADNKDDEFNSEDETGMYLSAISYIHALFMLVYMIEYCRFRRPIHQTLMHYWKNLEFGEYFKEHQERKEKEKNHHSLSKTTSAG